MHRPIFGHSFAVLVAPILLSVLAFYFLNKKKASKCENAKDADSGAYGSMTAAMGTNAGGSSSSPTETNNGASSSTIEDSYEVFLSFRGPDTRYGFADHLYYGLIDARIDAFRDDEQLRQGEEIGPNLLAAIKNSKIFIPILSEKYGESCWCLNELVQIMECKNNNTETVLLPIFYKVSPADVRDQTGSFGEKFHNRERERGSDPTTLEKWKQALREVSNLKGRVVNGSEAESVRSVVQEVLFELKKKFELIIPENLVGIDSHVKKVIEFVNKNSRGPLFIGIHGMGGIGKTTLAKTIYNKLSNQFEHRSFIADVRESCKHNGIHQLQNQLLNDIWKGGDQAHNEDEGINLLSSKLKGKKALIFLDDVDDDNQLKALAGNHNWFSSGSMIIITTRKESILNNANVDYQYEHEEMDVGNALVLFCKHAFRRDAPPMEFEDLTRKAVSTTGGLPLSLEVVGSFLCNKELKVWEDTIKKLKNVPHQEVQEKLMISYNALDRYQRNIFLDIACFFIGTDLRIASYMWDACGFFPSEGIAVMRLMSLIKVGENHELRMHDQLRDLGREIVRQEDEEPWKRSRLWDSEEVVNMLEENEGTEKVEAIYLNKGNNVLTGEQFKKLRNLRFLNARWAHFNGDFKGSMKELKWLHWKYRPSPFDINNFHVKELRVLKLRGQISDKWQGWSSITMAKKLKYLNLANCVSLEGTSFLSAFKNLEVLILHGCEKLKQIDSSIGNMGHLVCLDLTGCHSLKGLPAEVGKLKELKQLLVRIPFIPSLPDEIWALPNLEILDIRRADIENFPESIGALQNLIILEIGRTKIKKLPHDIERLRKLRYLSAEYCFGLEEEIPKGIHNLSSLQHLNLSFCFKLPSLPVLPSSLEYLSITCLSCSLSSLSNLTHLKELTLLDCEFLECFGEHPSTLLEKSVNTPFELEILEIYRCKVMKTLEVSQFNHLRRLCAVNCYDLLEIQGLNKLKYLDSLEINACAIDRFDLPRFEHLRIFQVKHCINLVEIQGLNKLESLQGIDISGCTSIARLDLPKSKGMKIFNVKDCVTLVEIQGLRWWESLIGIDISGCASIVRLDLPKSEGMKIIDAENCKGLVEIQGLDRLESLEEIDISGCSSLVRLDLPKSEGLKIFGDSNCQKLVNIRVLDKLDSLSKTGDFAYNFILGLNRRYWENWPALYGGLNKSLYKVS